MSLPRENWKVRMWNSPTAVSVKHSRLRAFILTFSLHFEREIERFSNVIINIIIHFFPFDGLCLFFFLFFFYIYLSTKNIHELRLLMGALGQGRSPAATSRFWVVYHILVKYPLRYRRGKFKWMSQHTRGLRLRPRSTSIVIWQIVVDLCRDGLFFSSQNEN